MNYLKQIHRETDPIVIVGICFFVLLLPMVIGDYINAQTDLRRYETEAKSKEVINYASTRP